MPNLMLAENESVVLAKLMDAFMTSARANGFNPNWSALIAWAEKWVPELFIPAVIDVISGNWAALFSLAASKGPEAIAELLAALGIALPTP